MIKIQLCPAAELEDKNWWHLDIIVFMLALLLSYTLMNQYMDSKRDTVRQLTAKKQRWDDEIKLKSPSVEKFKNLKDEKEVLTKKIEALRRITTSKLDKVKPIVALDQLQTLWMDGVWYESLELKTDGTVLIIGAAHDSLLIGEYMLGVKETMSSETINDDIRTQLGFDALALKTAKLVEAKDLFPDINRRMTFQLTGKFVEKRKIVPVPTSLGPRPRAVRTVHF